MTRQEVLDGALALNGADKKYTITVEGNTIITQTKWMDAVLFAQDSITDEVRSFKFTVELGDDNTWTELDRSSATRKSAGPGGFSMGYSSFSGKQISFNKTIAIGKDRNTGETGVVSITFNSEEFKQPVRDYLTACGWKRAKKGFWATLFGR